MVVVETAFEGDVVTILIMIVISAGAFSTVRFTDPKEPASLRSLVRSHPRVCAEGSSAPVVGAGPQSVAAPGAEGISGFLVSLPHWVFCGHL